MGISDDGTIGVLSWSSISTELLRAELARRDEDPPKPTCGSGTKGTYNTSAHVFALILILALSTIACGFPLISRRTSKESAGPNRFIFISQHFGTGVLIATAFVHLLPTAFISLTDPCLPAFFNEGYNALAGLVAMFSALIVVGLEMFLTTRGAGHSHSHGGAWDAVPEGEDGHNHIGNGSTDASRPKTNGRIGKLGLNHRPRDIALDDLDASEGLVAGVSPLPVSTPTSQTSTTMRTTMTTTRIWIWMSWIRQQKHFLALKQRSSLCLLDASLHSLPKSSRKDRSSNALCSKPAFSSTAYSSAWLFRWLRDHHS